MLSVKQHWGDRTALIGHTGFVGSTLAKYRDFHSEYNSQNFREIAGQEFDTIVCAGVPAAKWIANQNGKADWANIELLLQSVFTVKAKKFILISTVDVYVQPNGVTEADAPPENHPQAYGRNRYRLEGLIKERFENYLIVRLPGLFGTGLKKNVIYDLINDNMVNKLDRNTSFQWYPISRIGEDLDSMIQTDVPIFNIAVEPIYTGAIIDRFFPDYEIPESVGPTKGYDMKTLYANTLGGHGCYHISVNQVFEELEKYISGAPA